MPAFPNANELIKPVVLQLSDGADEEIIALAWRFLNCYLRYPKKYFFDVG